MGNMRPTRTVGKAESVNEAYIVFMLCTWGFGGAVEGGEGKGDIFRSGR